MYWYNIIIIVIIIIIVVVVVVSIVVLTSTLLLETNGESGGDEFGDMSAGLGRCEEASRANASTPDEGEMLCPAAAIICCRIPCATAATAAAAEFGDTGPSTD